MSESAHKWMNEPVQEMNRSTSKQASNRGDESKRGKQSVKSSHMLASARPGHPRPLHTCASTSGQPISELSHWKSSIVHTPSLASVLACRSSLPEQHSSQEQQPEHSLTQAAPGSAPGQAWPRWSHRRLQGHSGLLRCVRAASLPPAGTQPGTILLSKQLSD